jgi:hypothetical protein
MLIIIDFISGQMHPIQLTDIIYLNTVFNNVALSDEGGQELLN